MRCQVEVGGNVNVKGEQGFSSRELFAIWESVTFFYRVSFDALKSNAMRMRRQNFLDNRVDIVDVNVGVGTWRIGLESYLTSRHF
jgi:hypothetical protein